MTVSQTRGSGENEDHSDTRSVRSFPLGVVLSITQDRLACTFADLQEFVEYLLGEPVWTLGVAAAVPRCRQHVVEQHPLLADVTMADWVEDEVGVNRWLSEMELVYGRTVEVPPLPAGSFSAGGFVGEMQRFAMRDLSAGTSGGAQ